MLQKIARLGLLALFAALAACSTAPADQSTAARSRIIYGLTLQPSGFDPHIHASSELGIPLRQVYDTLIYRDPATGAFVPGLAREWSISPDGLIYTFSLRNDVRFHDGTPFNAQAVGANLDRITNPDTGSQRAVFMLGPYARYEIADDYTIRIILSEPYSPLLDTLSQVYLGMASPAALSEYSNERYQFHQVGTGPFTFVEFVPGDKLIIRRNPDYQWGPSFYNPPVENSVDEVEFRFFTDAPTRSIALEGGDAQVMGELLPTDARALTANSEIEIVARSIPGQPLQFIMNTANFPTSELRVRQALLFATNRNAIIDSVFQRFSPVAWGPLSAASAFYSQEVVGSYAYDVAQAQAQLNAAGLNDADGNGYLDAPGGADVEVVVIVPPWGLIPEVAQLLQDQWRDVGIRAVLDPVPSRTTLFERISTGDFNLVAYYEFGQDASLLNQFFLSSGASNWTGYASSDLDTALLGALAETNPDVRRQYYAQAQRIIMNQALILPIRDYVNLNGVRTSVQNLAYDAFGWFPLLPNVTVSE